MMLCVSDEIIMIVLCVPTDFLDYIKHGSIRWYS